MRRGRVYVGALQERRILVTGGAGFIGSHLTEALVAAGARVRVLDDLSTGRRENLATVAGEVELMVGDLRDAEACAAACDGAELVFHQAARGSVPFSLEHPEVTFAINVTGTANLLTAARDAGVERLIYASSSSVYGDSPASPKQEGEEGRPLSPYALSKRAGEELAELFGRLFAIETLGLRYFNVYGPRQDPEGPYAAVIPRFFDACRRGKAPVIHGDGEQGRDFTYVADAVVANLLAAAAPAAACGRAYNVGGGILTTINEIAARVRQLAGGPEPVHGPPRPGDVPRSRADLSLIRERLGYQPAHPLERGLAATAAFFLEGGR